MRPSTALLLAALLAPAALAAAAEPPEWQVYRSNIRDMPVGDGTSTVGDVLGPFLDHQFDLPLEFMRRAQVGGSG